MEGGWVRRGRDDGQGRVQGLVGLGEEFRVDPEVSLVRISVRAAVLNGNSGCRTEGLGSETRTREKARGPGSGEK